MRSATPLSLLFLVAAGTTVSTPLAAQWDPTPATEPPVAAAFAGLRAPLVALDHGGPFSVQQTPGRHWRKGFLWGFAVGGIVGGVAAYSFSPIVCDVAEDDSCRAVSVLLGVGIYGTGAGLVGMMIGGLVKREARTQVPFAGAEIGLSPRIGPRAPGSPWELGVHVDLPGR